MQVTFHKQVLWWQWWRLWRVTPRPSWHPQQVFPLGWWYRFWCATNLWSSQWWPNADPLNPGSWALGSGASWIRTICTSPELFPQWVHKLDRCGNGLCPTCANSLSSCSHSSTLVGSLSDWKFHPSMVEDWVYDFYPKWSVCNKDHILLWFPTTYRNLCGSTSTKFLSNWSWTFFE